MSDLPLFYKNVSILLKIVSLKSGLFGTFEGTIESIATAAKLDSSERVMFWRMKSDLIEKGVLSELGKSKSSTGKKGNSMVYGVNRKAVQGIFFEDERMEKILKSLYTHPKYIH